MDEVIDFLSAFQNEGFSKWDYLLVSLTSIGLSATLVSMGLGFDDAAKRYLAFGLAFVSFFVCIPAELYRISTSVSAAGANAGLTTEDINRGVQQIEILNRRLALSIETDSLLGDIEVARAQKEGIRLLSDILKQSGVSAKEYATYTGLIVAQSAAMKAALLEAIKQQALIDFDYNALLDGFISRLGQPEALVRTELKSVVDDFRKELSQVSDESVRSIAAASVESADRIETAGKGVGTRLNGTPFSVMEADVAVARKNTRNVVCAVEEMHETQRQAVLRLSRQEKAMRTLQSCTREKKNRPLKNLFRSCDSEFLAASALSESLPHVAENTKQSSVSKPCGEADEVKLGARSASAP